jgi:hypothetical protein
MDGLPVRRVRRHAKRRRQRVRRRDGARRLDGSDARVGKKLADITGYAAALASPTPR